METCKKSKLYLLSNIFTNRQNLQPIIALYTHRQNSRIRSLLRLTRYTKFILPILVQILRLISNTISQYQFYRITIFRDSTCKSASTKSQTKARNMRGIRIRVILSTMHRFEQAIERESHSNQRTIEDYLHSPGQVDDKAQEENRLMAGTAPRDIVIGYRMRGSERERERDHNT